MRGKLYRFGALMLSLWVALLYWAVPVMGQTTGKEWGAQLLTPVTGSLILSGEGAAIDYSNISRGYVLIRYQGDALRSKVQITKAEGTTYSYDLNTRGEYEVFSFPQGSGSYTVNVFRNVYDNRYAKMLGTTLDVALENETLPFLYPNQYINVSAESKTVKKAAELAGGAANDLEIVSNVYNYVVGSIAYDHNKAEQITAGRMGGYLPNVDAILDTGKGICFDYTAVMVAMLRSQNIPAKLEMGYVSGGVYHAWVSVRVQTAGWINGAVYTDGTGWVRMDPTFAAGASLADRTRYIGTGSDYNVSFTY